MTKKGSDERSALQRDLFDLITEFGGKVSLPYQMHYTRDQLVKAYPNFDKVDGMRTALDVDGVIANKLFSTDGKK